MSGSPGACGCRPNGRNPDVVLAHDQVVLTVDLDLGAAIFGEEDFVADFDIEFDLLAIVVELASTEGNDGPFLRLLFRRVGNDDISLLDFFLFERLTARRKNAISILSAYSNAFAAFLPFRFLGLRSAWI